MENLKLTSYFLVKDYPLSPGPRDKAKMLILYSKAKYSKKKITPFRLKMKTLFPDIRDYLYRKSRIIYKKKKKKVSDILR